MPDKIVINLPRYQGEYDLDLEDQPLTALEWRWIKKISGYLPLTLGDGLAGGDPDVFVAFAVVALARAGKIDSAAALDVARTLETAPFDGTAIKYIGEEVDVEDPPVQAGDGVPLRSIGGSSRQTSDPQGSDLSRTGVPA